MKKITIKILLAIIPMLLILDTAYASKISDYFRNGTTHDIDPTSIRDTIFGIMTYIGWGLAICVVLIVGIQFLTANTQKKAQLKEKLWMILLAIIILGGGMPLFRFFCNAFNGLRADIISSTNNDVTPEQAMGGIFSTGASTIQFIGYGVAIIMVIWLGIQWLLANPGKKAELKGRMWLILIGVILIVAASSLVGVIWGAAEGIAPSQIINP